MPDLARSHPRTRERIPHDLDAELIALRARGYTDISLADWLKATHDIHCTPMTVRNRIERLRAMGRAIVLSEPTATLEITREELLSRILAAEYELFREAKTVPERRAAQKEILRVIELERKFPVQADHGGRDQSTELLTAIRSVQESLKGLVPMTVIEAAPSDSSPADEIDKVD